MHTYDEARAIIDPYIEWQFRGRTWESFSVAQDDYWHVEVVAHLRAALGDTEVVEAHGSVRAVTSGEGCEGEIRVLTATSLIDVRFTATREPNGPWTLVPKIETVSYRRANITSVQILSTSEDSELQARIKISGADWHITIPARERDTSSTAARLASLLARDK